MMPMVRIYPMSTTLPAYYPTIPSKEQFLCVIGEIIFPYY